jgi:protein-disulfide isomerase
MRVSPPEIGVLVLALLLTGCALSEKRKDSPTVASGAGFEITLDELDEWVKESLFQEQTGGGDPARLYDVRSQALEALVRERVLTQEAEAEGKSVDELLTSQPVEIGAEEVKRFYEANRARLGQAKLEDVSPAIRSHLEEQKRRDQVNSLVARADVSILLEPPRFDVEPTGPARGPQDAPVTIVEFSDFECPYCKRAHPTLLKVLERYPERVRLVYRHLPLESIHARARPAALASACLSDQDRFWPYHDRVFESTQPLTDEVLRQHAEAVGADLEAYDACLEQDAKAAVVDADIAAARELGITGTPAFLINGVLITGAQPLESFTRVIERELAAAASAAEDESS